MSNGEIGPRQAILSLHAQTSLHPGAGTALGTVDLPVQREKHTHWPIIPGSALKGICRDGFREQVKSEYPDDETEQSDGRKRTARQKANEDNADLITLFGPGKVDESSTHAGALSITDARLLAYPVRSLRGVFAWVTCPAVLQRFKRDLSLIGKSLEGAIPKVEREMAAVHPECPCLVDDGYVLLEEFEFRKIDETSEAIANWIADNLVSDCESFTDTRERFRKHMIILSDDDFTHFVRHATEVIARIGLDYETKTVRKGALFYQEFLPPESLFYSVVIINPSRARNGKKLSSTDMMDSFSKMLPATLQVGGDESIGKGICSTRLF